MPSAATRPVPAALRRPDPLPLSDRLTLSRDEAARMVGISVRLLQRAISSGDVSVVRLGRRVLLRPTDVRAWLDRMTVSAPSTDA